MKKPLYNDSYYKVENLGEENIWIQKTLKAMANLSLNGDLY